MSLQTDVSPHGRVPRPVVRSVELEWQDTDGRKAVRLERDSGALILGSSEQAGRRILADTTVSRLHAEVEIRNGTVWVRDLGSRNGTYVNGVQIIEARLTAGSRLRLGATTLTVSLTVGESDAGEDSRSFGEMVAASESTCELFAHLSRLALVDETLLVLGETGTGKELVARGVHEASPRKHGPFVVVDCASLHPQLLESELFGHARGSFTGAVGDRLGAFEAADGGTLVLDEIGDLPLELQPKLLRVLEARTVRRVGENQEREVNVRIVASTHRDLAGMTARGLFREDLFFRLSVLVAKVPALRDRPDDIPLLVRRFTRDAERWTDERVEELMKRPWQGNVRELRNYVARVDALGFEDAARTSPSMRSNESEGSPLAPGWLDATRPFREVRAEIVEAFERAYVLAVLEAHDGNVKRAAGQAGLDRTYLGRLAIKHGLRRVR